jgi:phospholipid transport system substrate-binding protein
MLRKLCQFITILALPLVVVMPLHAEDAELSAYDVIEKTTNDVMVLVNGAGEYVDEDPERYYRELQALLDGLVDYAGFSRAVMGPYASKQRYDSLDSAGKQELRKQVKAFTGVMRVGLVRTYGKGLLAFGSSRTEVLRPEEVESEGRNIAVTQLIHGDAPEPYVILYQMRLGKKGGWKLRNLIVETINLGIIYRNQFLSAAKDYDGDVDQVIANWTAPDEDDELEQSARL